MPGNSVRYLERAHDHRHVDDLARSGAVDHRALGDTRGCQRQEERVGEAVAVRVGVALIDIAIVVDVAALAGVADSVRGGGGHAADVALGAVRHERAVVVAVVRRVAVRVGHDRVRSQGLLLEAREPVVVRVARLVARHERVEPVRDLERVEQPVCIRVDQRRVRAGERFLVVRQFVRVGIEIFRHPRAG